MGGGSNLQNDGCCLLDFVCDFDVVAVKSRPLGKIVNISVSYFLHLHKKD